MSEPGGAVLRVAGHVFLGWGAPPPPDEQQAWHAREEESEETQAGQPLPVLMMVVPGLLLVAATVVGLIPGAVPGIEVAASHFREHSSYISWVLHGAPHFAAPSTSHVQGHDYLYSAAAAAGAVAVAAIGIFGRRWRRRLPQIVLRPATIALVGLRELHSGHIGDYIAWWTGGAAVLGGASLVFLR